MEWELPGPITVKMGKVFETFWRASTHYLIKVWLEKGSILPNYVPWCGLEAYKSGVTMKNYFW